MHNIRIRTTYLTLTHCNYTLHTLTHHDASFFSKINFFHWIIYMRRCLGNATVQNVLQSRYRSQIWFYAAEFGRKRNGKPATETSAKVIGTGDWTAPPIKWQANQHENLDMKAETEPVAVIGDAATAAVAFVADPIISKTVWHRDISAERSVWSKGN